MSLAKLIVVCMLFTLASSTYEKINACAQALSSCGNFCRDSKQCAKKCVEEFAGRVCDSSFFFTVSLSKSEITNWLE